MSEEPNAGTPQAPRDGSWPRASGQPSAPQPVAPTEPAAPVHPTYPQQQYPQQPYPQQGQQQYPPQGQQQYPQQAYQQPHHPQMQQPSRSAASSVQLNLWLSVFFTWIPALIFYSTEKGKNQLADEYHRRNLNFSLLRAICGVAVFIPSLGILFFIAGMVLFVFHLVAAASAPASFSRGQLPKFVLNLDLVK